MPGVAIAVGARASNALAAMQREGLELRTYTGAATGVEVGTAGYPSYPILAVAGDRATALLEGAAYGPTEDAVRATLLSLANRFSVDAQSARSDAEQWASSVDGDFVIVVAAADGSRALVVNDRLGRLPLYWSSNQGSAAIAREIKCVREVCGPGDVDRVALAQMLLFSFPLGLRTLHRRIARLPEASSTLIDAGGNVNIRQYYCWNFEALHESAVRAGAAQLAERFIDRAAAQVAWAGSRALLLGLSGGLDSRAVAAALVRAGAHYSSVTFSSRRKKAAEETETSAQISRALGSPWEELLLAPPSWADEAKMANLRDGTSNVALAFLFEYFARLASKHGPNAVHFTGDGGDRALPDLRTEIPIANRDRFVDYRIANALWTVPEVARLVGLSRDEVTESVKTHFNSYPERNAEFLNVRFMIADWAFCRLFAGEDRNRSFMWSATPFYCQSFFEAAMQAPLKSKRYYGLYADFLRALDPRIVGISKSNWGYGVNSPLVRWQAWRDAASSALLVGLKGRFGSSGRKASRGKYGTPEHDPEFAALARRHGGVAFDPDALRAISDRGLDKLQYHMLATALLYVERAWGNGQAVPKTG